MASDLVQRGTRIVLRLFRIEDRLHRNEQPRELDAGFRRQHLEVVQPFGRHATGAHDDGVDRGRLQQHGERRVAAQHREALHANPRLARIIVDESDHAHVATVARQNLAQRQGPAVAGARRPAAPTAAGDA